MKRRFGVLLLGVVLGAVLMAVVQAQPFATASGEAYPVKTAVSLNPFGSQAGGSRPNLMYRMWSDGSIEVNTNSDLGWKGWKPME